MDAEQAQHSAPAPHPQDEVSSQELGGARCRTSASRQSDAMGHSRSTGWLAGGMSDDPWGAIHLLLACNRGRHDAAPGVSLGIASNEGLMASIFGLLDVQLTTPDQHF